MPQESKITIKIIKEVTSELAQDSARLVSQLSTKYQAKDPLSWLEKIVSSPNTELLVAFENQTRAVGMVLMAFYPLPEEFTRCWIEDVIVDEKSRGQNIAKRLMLTAFERAKELGIKQINLTSSPKRLAANQLYKGLGFELVETNFYRYLPK